MRYLDVTRPPLDARAALGEASRCLLCLDAPCSKGCPAGTDPGKFIRSLRFLNEEGAASTIRINNALGSLCARLCPTESLCQKGCLRAGLDKPIDIGGIQAYLTDLERENGWEFLSPGPETGKKVAVVGSGPSGLEAAAVLRTYGHAVDLYEKEKKAGGVLRYGIPAYRLEEKVLDYEIERILGLGVRLLTSVEVGKDVSPKTLENDYDAVLYCIGYTKGKVVEPFNGKPNVISALDLLRKIKGDPASYVPPKTVLVIGGGDVAMDVIGSLKRLGAQKVVCVAYEELGEFRASKKELDDALKEADSIIAGYVPESYDGRETVFRHRFLESRLSLKADLTVLAVGQTYAAEGLPLEFEKGTAKGIFHATTNPKVYFAGDIAPEKGKLVVHAVKSGKEAAMIIDKRIGGHQNGK